MRSREVLLADLQVLEAANTSLAKFREQANVRLNKLQLANKQMSHELALATAKLRVYDAFFSTNNNNILRPDVDASLSNISNAYDNINEFYRLRGDHDEGEEEDDDEDDYDERDDEHEYLEGEGEDGDDATAMYPILAQFSLSSRLRPRYLERENDDRCGQKSPDNDSKGVGGGQESTWTEINRLRSLNSFQLAVTGTATSNSSSRK